MATNDKRAELKSKVDAAQKRNQEREQQRTLGDYARDARDEATSFIKEHPITTIAGGIAVGVLVASVVPGPGRRLRKKATRRGAVLASCSTLQTLPVLQSVFQTQFSSNYNVAFASYLMAMAPAIIVYLFTQRWVMAGVTQGAIK